MNPVFRVIAPWIILAVGIGGFLILAAQRPVAKQPASDEAVPPVIVTKLTAHKGGLDICVDGVVVPFREIALAAEVAGRVTKKVDVARAGHYVTAGTVLLEIDPRDYQLAARQLQQELEQADVSLTELDVEVQNYEGLHRLAQEQLDLQMVEYERQQKLSERRVVTATQLDETRRNVLQAQSQLLELRKQIQMLRTRRSRLEAVKDATQLRLEKAQIDLERTRVVAPSDGVVIRDLVEADSYVNKGTELFMFEDTSKVEVRCNLLMDELYWLWLQQNNGATTGDAPAAEPAAQRDYQVPRTPATVVYELAGQKYTWQGELTRFEGIGLDDATRMAPCCITVDQPRHVRSLGSSDPVPGPPALVRGMFVTVCIHAHPKTDLLGVPEEAIRPGNRLWLLNSDKLRIVDVRVVQRHDGYAIVRPKPDSNDPGGKPLSAGMRVITSPLAVAEEGMQLREQKP